MELLQIGKKMAEFVDLKKLNLDELTGVVDIVMNQLRREARI